MIRTSSTRRSSAAQHQINNDNYDLNNNSNTHKRSILRKIEQQLDVTHWEEWYKVTTKQWSQKSILSLRRANETVSSFAMSMYPQHDWKVWKFERHPHGMWKTTTSSEDDHKNSKKNHLIQREYMDWLGRQIGVKTMEDWYEIGTEDLLKHGGSGLLVMNNWSATAVVKSVYPEYPWLGWRFRSSSKRYWENVDNQRQFMDWLGKQLGIAQWQDWYKVTRAQIGENGGWAIIHRYNGSPSSILTTVYPQFSWELWKFDRSPREFWNDENQVQQYLQWVAKELNIKSIDDWMILAKHRLAKLKKGSVLLEKCNYDINRMVELLLGGGGPEMMSNNQHQPQHSVLKFYHGQGYLYDSIELDAQEQQQQQQQTGSAPIATRKSSSSSSMLLKQNMGVSCSFGSRSKDINQLLN